MGAQQETRMEESVSFSYFHSKSYDTVIVFEFSPLTFKNNTLLLDRVGKLTQTIQLYVLK